MADRRTSLSGPAGSAAGPRAGGRRGVPRAGEMARTVQQRHPRWPAGCLQV